MGVMLINLFLVSSVELKTVKGYREAIRNTVMNVFHSRAQG